MDITVQTTSSLQTETIAELLGTEIASYTSSKPIVIALCGELGAGKTTFVKGLARGLGIEANITSPTFVLISKYVSRLCLRSTLASLKSTFQVSRTLYHVDPYRLTDEKSILPDLKELFSQKNVVIAVEWGERFLSWLPKDAIWVTVKHRGGDKRELRIKNYESRIKGLSKL